MIGIFGGTFDPIHYGHLRPAQEAFEQLGLSELRFVPANVPPLRAAPVASAAQRLAMVERAIAGFTGFRADDRELRRGGPSYTVDTLEALRAELGTAPLCLLIGLDQFAHFEQWHRWTDIAALAHLVVLNRPGAPAAPVPGWVQSRRVRDVADLRRTPGGRLAFLAVHPQDISATGIRARLARGEPIAGLVPEAVREYIQSNHLYGPSDRGA